MLQTQLLGWRKEKETQKDKKEEENKEKTKSSNIFICIRSGCKSKQEKEGRKERNEQTNKKKERQRKSLKEGGKLESQKGNGLYC